MEGRDQNRPEQGCWEQSGVPQAGAAAEGEHHQSPELPEGTLPQPEESIAPAGSPSNGNKRRTWLWVLAGALLLAGAAAAVLLTVVLPAGSGSTLIYNPINPLIYEEDGSYYVAVGAESIELEDIQPAAGYGSLNAGMDVGNTYLYFLADAKNGEGTLMRLKLNDAAATPEAFAENVCGAKISNDGSRVLLLRDIDGGIGDLYLWTVSGEEKLDTSVVADSLDFSPNSQNLSYFKADSGDSEVKTLCLKIGSSAAEEVADVEGTYAFGYPQDDDGLIYTVTDEEGNSTLYRYVNGKEDRIGRGDLYFTFNSGELLYVDRDKLYYYQNGSRERITKEFSTIIFSQREVITYDRNVYKHFALAEGNSEDGIVLYECVLGRDPVKITKTDDYWTLVSNNFDWVAYQKNGRQYLAHKKGSKWEDRIKVKSDVYYSRFDKKGRYLYVLDNDKELGRYILANREFEELYDDVANYWLIGDGIYVVTDDKELYRVTAKSDDLIAEDVTDVVETEGGGFYVVMETADGLQEIEYYAPGADKGELVATGVTRSKFYVFDRIRYITVD